MGWLMLGGWVANDNGFTLRFEDHHIHVWRGGLRVEQWGVVWVHRNLTLVEESGFATLNDCMSALWRHVFRITDERTRLQVEEAKRIIGTTT